MPASSGWVSEGERRESFICTEDGIVVTLLEGNASGAPRDPVQRGRAALRAEHLRAALLPDPRDRPGRGDGQ